MNKKIILISIFGLLIIGFFSFYNSLDPQNIKKFLKETIFVFMYPSILEQKQDQKLIDKALEEQVFEFKKNEIKNKKLHNINLSLKTFTLPFLNRRFYCQQRVR